MSPVLPGGYEIRELRLEDAGALAASYLRNREHLARWEPRREAGFYTTAGQEAAITGRLAATARGRDGAWVVVHAGEVVGRVNLSNVVMGAFCSGSLGYWVDHRHLRRGLATAAVRFACAEAAERGLHRVEAGTLLHNEASQAVLRRCGFVEVGLAERYLFLDGAWRDHRLFQRILHDRPL